METIFFLNIAIFLSMMKEFKIEYKQSEEDFRKLFHEEVGISLELRYDGNIEQQLIQLEMVRFHCYLICNTDFKNSNISTIYDVGAGSGSSTKILLYESETKLVYVDPDPKMVAIAKDRFYNEDRVTLLKTKIEDIPVFEDNSAIVSFFPRSVNGSACELEKILLDVYLHQKNVRYLFIMPSAMTICDGDDFLELIRSRGAIKDDVEERMDMLKNYAKENSIKDKNIIHPPAIENYHAILFRR